MPQYLPIRNPDNNRVCIVCGKNFRRRGGKKLIVKFCSRKCKAISQIGKPTWIKGKKMSVEYCKKLSESHKNSLANKEHLKILHKLSKGKHYSPKTEFKKGINPWNTGKKLPQFSGENACHWTGGKPKCVDCGVILSYYAKRCTSCSSMGKLNNFWRGGITSLNKQIRGLSRNNQWRDSVFKRDGYVCQDCKSKSEKGKTVFLNAHHKTAFKYIMENFLKEYDQFSPIDDKVTLARLAIKHKPFWDIDNGITLCEKCHNLTKNGGQKCSISL